MARVCMYGHELPFADGRRIGRSWRTAGRLPERLMSEPRANIPTPLVPSWWSPRLVPRSPRPRSTGREPREKGLFFRSLVASRPWKSFVTFVNGLLSPRLLSVYAGLFYVQFHTIFHYHFPYEFYRVKERLCRYITRLLKKKKLLFYIENLRVSCATLYFFYITRDVRLYDNGSPGAQCEPASGETGP